MNKIKTVILGDDIKMRVSLRRQGELLDLHTVKVLQIRVLNREIEASEYRCRWRIDSDETILYVIWKGSRNHFIGVHAVELKVLIDERVHTYTVDVFKVVGSEAEMEDWEWFLQTEDGEFIETEDGLRIAIINPKVGLEVLPLN